MSSDPSPPKKPKIPTGGRPIAQNVSMAASECSGEWWICETSMTVVTPVSSCAIEAEELVCCRRPAADKPWRTS